jgi:ATP-dependent helicase HepA
VQFRGMLVDLPRRRGVGKLEAAGDGRCSVSVFHSILHTETLDLAMKEINRAFLSPQTRVYVKQDDRFRVGRVTNYLRHENGLVDYEVRFPKTPALTADGSSNGTTTNTATVESA